MYCAPRLRGSINVPKLRHLQPPEEAHRNHTTIARDIKATSRFNIFLKSDLPPTEIPGPLLTWIKAILTEQFQTASVTMAPFDRPLNFHVQSAVDKTQTFPHHDSITQLWELRWRDLCRKAEYPFGEAAIEDFEPIFASLIASFHNDATALVDNPDGYAAPFLPVAAALVREAEECEKSKDTSRARDLFLRAAAVYRIARFPVNRSPRGQKAWDLGRAAYLRGGAYLDPPVREVAIQFSHAKAGVDEADRPILANLRIPSSSSSPQQKPPNGWPVLLLISGLDSYRSDSTTRTTAHLATGLAVLNVDIPGTADSPAAAGDPSSSDRLFSSVLDWIATTGKDEFQLDPARVVARGCSTGGYHALRLAHTHADRLLAVICHGGACH